MINKSQPIKWRENPYNYYHGYIENIEVAEIIGSEYDGFNASILDNFSSNESIKEFDTIGEAKRYCKIALNKWIKEQLIFIQKISI